VIWRTSSVAWASLPSAIDGIEFPNITLADGGGGHLAVIVSQWSEGRCIRVHTVEFDHPEAFCAVEEATYSILSEDNPFDLREYLKVAKLDAHLQTLARTREMMVGKAVELNLYLLVGLTECLEVVSSTPPRIVSHASYERALAHAASARAA
jgi:hypothetical protein